MENTFALRHENLQLESSFEHFTASLENTAGKFDYAILDRIGDNPEGAQSEIRKMQGEQDLMIFTINDHGKVLSLLGIEKKVIQYQIGNPLIAGSMTSKDLLAATYAPLRVLVYQGGDGKTFADYEQPSAIFGQFADEDIKAVGRALDQKFKTLLLQADKAALAR
jgi:uncharacterized protein (DUF302 family)